MIEVLTAAKEGKAIQERNGVDWKEFSVADRLRHREVRVKPEPRRFWIHVPTNQLTNTKSVFNIAKPEDVIEVVEVIK
jgi:hypothetical protein